ncbi:MAG: calcium-binding protein [Nostoc sp.]
MANIIGTNSNDTLLGSNGADTINGKAGNDNIVGNTGNDTLTGGGGKDKFVYNFGDGTDTITDFGGIGKGTNPTAAVIAEVDTIKFFGAKFTARNLLLTQNGSNLEITFDGVDGTKVILQNFKLENLENLKASGGIPAIGNILFDGQTNITDNFNVLDADSTDTSLGIKNTVTFLNDLSNNITGLDNSDDVVNGQGGNDEIDGKSGNDLLRGGAGNDNLIGGAGNNTLYGGTGDDFLNADISTGNNLLDGGTGKDFLSARDSTGDNLLSGGDGNDALILASSYTGAVSGNNTLKGGAGEDDLEVANLTGNNLLDGGDGNDIFILNELSTVLSSLVTQTVDGGTGNDDVLYINFYYGNPTEAITSAFNATTNQSSITVGTNRVNYKNIERLGIRGTLYDDNIVGSNGNDTLYGGSNGSDTIIGAGGNDYLDLDASTGKNLLSGGDGNDTLFADGSLRYYRKDLISADAISGNNTLNGGTGNDTLNVNFSTGDNLLSGGDGNDSLSASAYFDNSKVYAASGNNTLNGGAGNDTLSASSSTGDNLLSGDDGNDILTGGNGNDSLYGGNGIDTFAFNSYNQGVDRLNDFNATNEVIQVSATGFGGGLSPGSLSTSQFTLGISATAIAQRFIYDNITGALYFDQDGSASGFTQVKFAQLLTGVSLTKNNFAVV